MRPRYVPVVVNECKELEDYQGALAYKVASDLLLMFAVVAVLGYAITVIYNKFLDERVPLKKKFYSVVSNCWKDNE